MERAFPFGQQAPPAPPSRAPRLDAPRHDPFREKAEKQAAKLAEREAKRGRPAQMTAAAAGAGAFNDPFAKPARPPRAAAMKPKPGARVLANGAELQLVSSSPAPKEKAVPPKKEKHAPPPKVEKPVRTVTASATTIPATPTPPKEKVVDAEYWGANERRGKGGGGDDGGRKRFDQDDIAAILIGLALLLLLGWVWFKGMFTGGADPVAAPQLAANEAAKPLPDPFGPGPVDLRPTSPMPEATVAPAVVPPAVEAAPAPPPPPTQASAPVATNCEAAREVRAYFCTARSTLTPASRAAFERGLSDYKSCFSNREIVVTGYADTRGTPEFNLNLGSLRADYLAGVMREQGFTVTEAVSVGELPDIEDGQNCQNQRRVDISLKGDALPTPTRACAPPREVVVPDCD